MTKGAHAPSPTPETTTMTTTHKLTTRDDLKPGAVFTLMVDDYADNYGVPRGTRLVVARDYGGGVPLMRFEDENISDQRLYVGLHEMTPAPAVAEGYITITVSRDTAETFVSRYRSDGGLSYSTDSAMSVRSTRAAIRSALSVALVETDPAVAEARRLLESKGFTVARKGG